MSFHLQPILNNGKLNELFNPVDFQYEYDNVTYSQGDDRYIKKSTYTSKMTSLDNSLTAINTNINTIDNTIQNISYNTLNNTTNIQDVNSGTIYQDDAKKIIQSTGTSTAYNYLQNTTVTNLNVTGTLTIPSNTTIAGATYNNDIVLNDPARILQSGTGINNLNTTNFTGNVVVSGTLQGLSTLIYGYLSTISSNVQSQFNSLKTKTTEQTYTSATTTTNFSGNVLILGNLQGLSTLIYGYLSTISSNVQTQLNTLTTNLSTINTNLQSQITTLQTNTTGVTYDSVNFATSINNIIFSTSLNGISSIVFNYLSGVTSNIQSQFNSINQKLTKFGYNSANNYTDISSNLSVYGNLSFTESINSTSMLIFNSMCNYCSTLSSNCQDQLNSITQRLTNMTYSSTGNNTTFNSNVNVVSLNGINSTELNTLIGIDTTYSIESRIWNIQNNINVFYGPFFAFITTPAPTGYDIYYNCGHMFLGAYITFSTGINGISATVFNYLANVTSDIQTQFNSIVSNVSSITQRIQGISHNDSNNYCDINSNVGIYGNFGFSGKICQIPRETFMYISNVTSDIQTQFSNINSTLLNITRNTLSDINIIKSLTDFQGNVFFGLNTDNTSYLITQNYLSNVILNSQNPTSYQTSIINDISCSSINVPIATINIIQNQYINLYFTPSLDFNQCTSNYISRSGYANVNPFTNTINSISFTIYKDGVLFNTITQTINFTKTYYGTVPTGTISSFSDSQTYYATTCSTFLVDNRFLEYNTQYDIYASVIQSNTNSSGQVSIYGNYACDSTSNFKYNSSNTTYSSNFSFSYSNGTNTNAIVNGANYCNQQYSNTLCCGTINNDIANITTLNNTTLNSIVANIDILAATNANLTTSNINTLNATNTNLTNLALSNGIDWSTSLHGSMTQMAHLNNINVSQGGTIKMYTALHTGLFLLVVNDGSNTDYNMQYILMVYFSQNAAHLVQIFNNPGNKWAYGLITTQPSISFWNSGYSASYTDFYLYGVRLF